MDRSFRHYTEQKTRNFSSIITLLISMLLLLFFAGFKLGASYIYASEREVATATLGSSVSIAQESVYPVFAPKVVDIITKNGQERHLVYGYTVSDILFEIGYTLDEDDLTIPSLDKVVSDKGSIQIIDIEIEYKVKKETIPFKTIEKKTDSLNTGTFNVSQEGENGLLAKTLKIMYQDGIAVSSTVVNTVIEKQVVDKIILVGTKPITIQSCGYWDNVIDRYVSPTEEKQKNDWMKFIMRCETWCDSGQNTRNVYLGLYQFNARTYRSYGGTNIWDGADQIRVVSSMYETAGNRGWHWPTCNSKYLSR